VEVSSLVAKNQAEEIKQSALREKEVLLKKVEDVKEDALKEKELLLKEVETIKEVALREKESILKEAENKAEQILAEAEAKVHAKKKEIEDFVNKAQEDFEKIKRNGQVAKAKLRSLLETELRIMYEEQFAEEARQEAILGKENEDVEQIQDAQEVKEQMDV